MTMRLLANENVAGETVAALRERGHDVFWARTHAPGASDRELLERAQTEARILITFDRDFGELAVRFGLPASCGVILFRTRHPSPSRMAAVVVAALATDVEWPGHFAVVEEGRIRVRPLRRLNDPPE